MQAESGGFGEGSTGSAFDEPPGGGTHVSPGAGEVAARVHCPNGFRAAIGASLLDRAGRKVVHIDDDWARAAQLRLPVTADD